MGSGGGGAGAVFAVAEEITGVVGGAAAARGGARVDGGAEGAGTFEAGIGDDMTGWEEAASKAGLGCGPVFEGEAGEPIGLTRGRFKFWFGERSMFSPGRFGSTAMM